MNRTILREAWVILVEECGADFKSGASFIRYGLDYPDWTEWRFGAKLGFGGKIWQKHQPKYELYVSYYAEDETDERYEMMQRANKRLKELCDANS